MTPDTDRIGTVDALDARALYAHMKRDFPAGELPPYFAVKGNIEKKVYDAFYLTAGGEIIGYAIVTAPADCEFALLTFFAVLPEFRSRGYGGECLRVIRERCDRKIVLEVEDPAAARTDESRDIALRRVRFYERAGFRLLPTAKARIFGVDMLIMTDTRDDVGSVRNIMHALYRPAFGSAKWLRCINVRDNE